MVRDEHFLGERCINGTSSGASVGVTFGGSEGKSDRLVANAKKKSTIYRNYFAPVGGSNGQMKDRQLDGLADLGRAFSETLSKPVEALWQMQNGYALCTGAGLDAVAQHLGALQPDRIDTLRSKLRIGVHNDVEVTDVEEEQRPLVSQAFCSALPVAYSRLPSARWKPFASLVLEAAYEATLLTAALNKRRGASNIVLLTLVGGGAFGNEDDWIYAAIRRALGIGSGFELDVRLVSYREPSPAIQQIVKEFG